MIVKKESQVSRGANRLGRYPDLVCFSHLRWDFVYQRPQHLLSRAALERRVFFIEEPIFEDCTMRLETYERDNGVKVIVPFLPEGLQSEIAIAAVLKEMIHALFEAEALTEYVFWYYTPMALKFTEHFNPLVSIYDCMDELSAFKDAPMRLRDYEKQLFKTADLVFTGGQSLYEAKKQQHPAVHAFPSSIDVTHFQQGRSVQAQPPDQKGIASPRLGFFGVIDERFDIELLDRVAAMRPEWNFVMIGPVVKIDPAALPARPNIHYLGAKKYDELPRYLAGWDVALLLFARNEATRFISPTKTPEYLAAGKPVISTSIHDVVRPYADLGLVRIADGPEDFVKAAEELLAQTDNTAWLQKVDSFLVNMSWDQTWLQMWRLIEAVIEAKHSKRRPSEKAINLKRRRVQVA
jgi:UDP-galactopyranose mutase